MSNNTDRLKYHTDEKLMQILRQRFGYQDDEIKVMREQAQKKGQEFNELVVQCIDAITESANDDEAALGWDSDDSTILTDSQKKQAEFLGKRSEEQKKLIEERKRWEIEWAKLSTSQPADQDTDEAEEDEDEDDEGDEDEDEKGDDAKVSKPKASRRKRKAAKNQPAKASKPVPPVEPAPEIAEQIAATGADVTPQEVVQSQQDIKALLSLDDVMADDEPPKPEKKAKTLKVKNPDAKKKATRKKKS